MATRTTAQRRARAREQYNVFMAECPSRQLLDRLSDKWVTMVLLALASGPHRYSEIARAVAGVSQKMLTQTLRQLERDGLVGREVTPAVPVRVDYALTELGTSLLPVMAAVRDWAELNMPDVRAARSRYDSRAARAAV